MCGIAGIALADGAAPVDRGALEAMAAAIAHRGPDGEGFHLGPGIGLASRRLAIIDVAGGAQPLANEDGTVVCVYNGEIYNFAALRAELAVAGHRFATATDGEVICHLYEEHGDALVEELRGMFAFALWDARRRRLLLARDRFGIKPLYHASIPGGIAFASELKALTVLSQVSRDLDEVALSDYLTYLYVPAPRTILAGVGKLPPASRLVFEHGRTGTERWWEPPAPGTGGPVDPHDAADELRARLREAVTSHLVADVPVGAFLSGGLDSSAVVALMAEASSAPVKTFTVGFEGAGDYDERPAARAVAERFGCDHHEVVVDPARALDALPACVWHLDEPLADATALASFLLARDARRDVTVALTGVGGDEIFAGYRRYQAQRLERVARALGIGLFGRTLERAAARLPASGVSGAEDLIRLARKFLDGAGEPLERRYLRWNAAFTDEEKGQLIMPGVGEHLSLTRGESLVVRAATPGTPFVARAQRADLKTYLPHDPLALTDATTMAWGLEARVPLCDHVLAEWALSVPPHLHVRGLGGKALLRRAVAGLVPASVTRRRKRGFSLPTDLWLRGDLGAEVARLLAPEKVAQTGLFWSDAVERLLVEHASGRRDRSQHLWALVVFEVWRQVFFEGAPADRLQEVG